MNHPDRACLIVGALLIAATLAVAFAGCKAHFEEEVQRHEIATSISESDAKTDTHIVDAPDRTTTTTEELDEAGRVRKRSTEVKDHGAVVTDKHADAKSQERGDSELDDTHHTDDSVDFLHSPLTWIGAVVVAGTIGGAIWKFTRKAAVPL